VARSVSLSGTGPGIPHHMRRIRPANLAEFRHRQPAAARANSCRSSQSLRRERSVNRRVMATALRETFTWTPAVNSGFPWIFAKSAPQARWPTGKAADPRLVRGDQQCVFQRVAQMSVGYADELAHAGREAGIGGVDVNCARSTP